MTVPDSPTATYRLQFHSGFTFHDAKSLVGYLHQLGISHVYASPFLKARPGSTHGYDIVDHNALNPDIGDQSAFRELVETLHAHDMGLILDIVPNHMGVGGCDNAWWLDVLQHGQASEYAGYFDIDWHPLKSALDNKLLLPFLGDHYGTVLEGGELKLTFHPESGEFMLRYYEHCMPLDPRTWPALLERGLEGLHDQHGDTADSLQALAADCRSLPPRTALSPEQRRRRREGSAECKRRLAQLCRNIPDVSDHLQHTVEALNGTPGNAASFDELHRLIEAQAYRPAYWQVASDEINYRRFFDINDLAGLRMDDPEVFAATHRLIFRLVREKALQGLRVDHLDGLSDPAAYCNDLRSGVDDAGADTGFVLLAEKILATHEDLPPDWPISGTTGYEVAFQLNGLFVRPDAERPLTRLYTRFTGRGQGFNEILYHCKKRIMRSLLSSELTVLATRLNRIAEADRHTRDFTYHSLRDALTEIVACFPVYRTYVTSGAISEQDQQYIHWSVAQAKHRSPASDIQVFDFIHAILLLQTSTRDETVKQEVSRFIKGFQQYTAPVMAKGMEDTGFYVYNRLTSLNDVGFDPRSFGITPAAFHHGNSQRQAHWPGTLAASSTHDSKRGEDVRARINVLSELPTVWRKHLNRWSRLNRRKKRQVDGFLAPSRNDEYLLYQTLLGIWPLQAPDDKSFADLEQRLQDYMLKAVREAKEQTSWINPHPEYEAALGEFIQALFRRPQRNAFLTDFQSMLHRFVRPGLYNSLSQALLKLALPGCPDLYQGNELWAFNLVDPDNRRPVDYTHRRTLLEQLARHDAHPESLPSLLQELLTEIEDGRAKLYVTWKVLDLRCRLSELFTRGEYLPLSAAGHRQAHLVAFMRRHENRTVIVATARWLAELISEQQPHPTGAPVWQDTWLELPPDTAKRYRNPLSGREVLARRHADHFAIEVSELFRDLPVALLVNV